MKVKWIKGQPADAGQLDDDGLEMYEVRDGNHRGHQITVTSHKYNCGAYGEEVACTCGAEWHSAMNGCWQVGHQHEEGGDPELHW